MAESTLPLACHVSVVQHAVFGRILQATDNINAGDNVVCQAPVVLIDPPEDRRGWTARAYIKAYAKLTSAQKAFLQTFASNAERTNHPISRDLPSDVDHFR
mmetsp:Transcript_160743/g.511394  ORF Transcript_160743/g.511394 Transcript_160743/m.511394 type:complete len:101 (-) Transcript_160743:922-1224(-)